ELHPSRDLAHNPLFQVLFSYHDEDAEALRLPGCEVELVPGDSGTAKFDLTMSLVRAGGRLSARLEDRLDLFADRRARRLADRFRTVLATAVAAPDRRLGSLPVLPEPERRQVLVDWNIAAEAGVAAEATAPQLVYQLIAAQVARTPDAVALVS